MIKTGQLAPPKERCDVFRERLVYLFYGRPAYKTRIDKKQRVIDEYLPVALVLNASAVSTVRRVFPFDSGAFHAGGYLGAHHKSAKFSDYKLKSSISAAQRLVNAFFETNGKYLLGQCRSSEVNSFDEPEVHAHFSLIAGKTKSKIDDRRYTVEIQTQESLDLNDGLLAFVVPHRWLESEIVINFLKNHPTIKPLSYAGYQGASITTLYGAIFERVRDYLLAERMV